MSNSQSSNEEEEISALEYAHQNGLACNHLAQPRPLSALASLAQSLEDGVEDDSHLPQFEFLDHSTDERLPISKGAAQLLAWVSKPEKVDSINSVVLSCQGKRGTRPRRLELPLLRSDHETDCKQFAKREGFEITLKGVRLPLEFVDADKDEGLVFPFKLWEKGASIVEELEKERIPVTKQGIMYLQHAVADKWDEIEEKEIWSSLRKYKKTKALEPVTPPLSPLSPPPQFFEPTSSDPAFQLPLLSDPPSLTKEDLDSVEEKIWKEDLPTPLRVTRAARGEMSPDATTSEGTLLGDIYSPLAFLDGVTTPPVTEPRKKNEDLKIEETLTPPDPSPIPKMVQFSDFIEEITFPEASPPIEEDLDHFFNDAFGDAGERAMRMVEQETLIAADTTARVKVPILDFSVPDPPWKAFQKQRSAPDLLATQTAFMVDILGQELLKWPGSKQGELKLKWNPFPHAQAKVNTEEDFPQDDSTWESIVFDPEDVQINRDVTVTWKPPGLRILKSDYDNDDEIDPGEFQKKFLPDLSYLVKKRKLEIEERRSEEPIVARPNSSAARIPRKNTPKQNDFMTAAEKLKSDKSHAEDLGLLGDAFSTENALDNYLEMRGKKKQKLVESSYFGTTAGTHVQAPLRPTSGPSDRIQLPIRNSPVSKAEPLPAPSIRPPAVPPNLIVSTLLIKNRPLIKQLESQLPGVKLIERDFSAHNSTAWLPNSVTRSPITSSLSSEADINVSPFTGIIITTLQKIKQKALPGQKTKPAIRDRMEKVSIRYERVVVLVSEGRSDGSTNGLDEGGCQALTDFVGFTIGLDSNVIVHFVGGGNETLSKWLVSTIVQHSVVGACDLLDDETHWELFLRRAGMNAYAAQAVLGELKAPEGVDPTSPSKAGCFGLVAFVEMDKEQRIARFERLCGRKLLERVSACIDERWE